MRLPIIGGSKVVFPQQGQLHLKSVLPHPIPRDIQIMPTCGADSGQEKTANQTLHFF